MVAMDYVNLTQQRQLQAVDALKNKVIEEFYEMLCRVRKGYRVNYEYLLEEISFINLIQDKEIDDKLSLTILQYYLNGKYNSKDSGN
nr:MAG TPA: hypothetical protein [Bacteriophage sp.]